MPPKTRYTAERILDCAYELTREQGIEQVTARNVAVRLGCSTAPVFTQFPSMDALHERLMERVIAHFVAVASEAHHADPLVAAGVGWLRFASDEPRLYEAVFLRAHPWSAKWGPIRQRLAERMATQSQYAQLSRRQRFALVGRASIVMHGLGLEIWSGRLPPTDLPRLVRELAVPVVRAALEGGWLDDLHTRRSDAPGATTSHTTDIERPKH